MKKTILLISAFFGMLLFLSSCETTGTEQIVNVWNLSSQKMLLSYETAQKKETVELSDANGRGHTIYDSYRFEGEFPKFTEAEFLEIVKDVRISLVTDSGDTIVMSKNFAMDYNLWKHEIAVHDETNIHRYFLKLTDDDID